MTNEELFAARTNPDFLKFLEEARVNSIKDKNIELILLKLYFYLL